jgi:hypothetical protein
VSQIHSSIHCQSPMYLIYPREKQSVALVIAMGGLYPCPEEIEAIMNPEDGQPKHILDLGVYWVFMITVVF